MNCRSIVVTTVCMMLCGQAASGDFRYVNQAIGSDDNDGIANDDEHAWATIDHAVDNAPAGSTVRVMSSPHTESGISIGRSITVQGLGANRTIVQAHANPGSAGNRVFSVDVSGGMVVFQDMTIRHGNVVGNGGGIVVSGSSGPEIRLERCSVTDNYVYGSQYTEGGGLYVSGGGGMLVVTDCNFARNRRDHTSAFRAAGAIRVGSVTNCIIQNSTFSSNFVRTSNWVYGSALKIVPTQVGCVRNCTFVHNRMIGAAGGAAVDGVASDRSKVLVESCVFANNIYGNTELSNVRFTRCVYKGPTYHCTDLGNNIVTTSPGVDLVLADNGGPTLTHALLKESPAYNFGSNPGNLVYDQRGRRYVRVGFGAADCGAYEIQPPLPGTSLIIW